jgi:hypothetical protein
MITGMVESVDRKRRVISVNNGDVLIGSAKIQREYVYGKDGNTMMKQRGVMRYLENFDLYEYRPEANILKVENYIEQCKKIKEKGKEELRSKLKETNIPSDIIK